MDTGKEIVMTAVELFKEIGYNNTTIAMICQKAKISKGTFYYHFSGKSDLIYAHIDSFMSNISDVFPEILLLEDPKMQLWELYKYSFENIIAMNPNLLLALYKTDIENKLKVLSPSRRGNYMYHTNSFAKMVLSLVKKCQDIGSVTKQISAQNLITAFESAVIGTGLDWACTNGEYNEVDRLRLIFDSIFR